MLFCASPWVLPTNPGSRHRLDLDPKALTGGGDFLPDADSQSQASEANIWRAFAILLAICAINQRVD